MQRAVGSYGRLEAGPRIKIQILLFPCKSPSSIRILDFIPVSSLSCVLHIQSSRKSFFLEIYLESDLFSSPHVAILDQPPIISCRDCGSKLLIGLAAHLPHPTPSNQEWFF